MTNADRLALLNQALGYLNALQADLAGGAPAPIPPPPTTGDDIDLSTAAIVGGAPDVRHWPIVTHLTIPSVEPAIVPSFPDPGWPDVHPPGFKDGDMIQYTVWAFAKINGQWVGSAFIEMWRGRPNCGTNDAGSARAQLQRNWWYYPPEMAAYLPSPGEAVGFMVTSGDQRRGRGPDSVQQRSNVVLVTLP